MRYLLFSFILATCIASCSHKPKLQGEFNNARFESTIVNNLPLYDSLKDIMIMNIDTIIGFRNSTQHNQTSNSYIFNYSEPDASEEGIDDMPAFIYPAVEKICRKIGKENLKGFTLYLDSAMSISVRSIYKENVNASVNHRLYWKMRFTLDPQYDTFIRDTALGSQWTYHVSVDERIE